MVVLMVTWLHIELSSQVCEKLPMLPLESLRESMSIRFFIGGSVEEEDIWFLWEFIISLYILIFWGEPPTLC